MSDQNPSAGDAELPAPDSQSGRPLADPAATGTVIQAQHIEIEIAKRCMIYGRHAWRLKDLKKGHTDVGAGMGWVFPNYDPRTHPPFAILAHPPHFYSDGTALRLALFHGIKTDEQKKAYISALLDLLKVAPDADPWLATYQIHTAPTQYGALAFLAVFGITVAQTAPAEKAANGSLNEQGGGAKS